MRAQTLLKVACCLMLAGCATTTDPNLAGTSRPLDATLTSAESVKLAVVDSRRLPADSDRDTARHPAKVLEFFGVGAGMVVLDLYSGGGYYTELASYVVGECGTVWSHNNKPYLAFAADELAERFKPGRLGNVQRINAENNALSLPPETFDVVLMVLAYHDIYFVDETNGWHRIDGPALLKEIFQAMKPGAVLGVVDHAAANNAPVSVSQSLHRIDPGRVRREIEQAGFTFDALSTVLSNPRDDHTLPVFAPEIRGNTDRFVYRFRRP